MKQLSITNEELKLIKKAVAQYTPRDEKEEYLKDDLIELLAHRVIEE